jgi:hypothetical protein
MEHWMNRRTLMALTLAAALGCDAANVYTYSSVGSPQLWISYPAEGDSSVCLSADPAHELPVHFTMYYAPPGARVRFTLDRYKENGTGGRVLGTTALSPFIASLAGLPDAEGPHTLTGEIVNADGSPLTEAQLTAPGTTVPNVMHEVQVSFTTKIRSGFSTGTSNRCPAESPP